MAERPTLEQILAAYHREMAEQYEAGRREILTVDVLVHEPVVTPNEDGTQTVALPFEGTAESPWFSGTIETPAADVQRHRDGRAVEACADYYVSGTGRDGAPCRVRVTNRFDGERWKPTLASGSPAMSFVNGADCHTVVEPRRQGPVIHIFCGKEDLPER